MSKILITGGAGFIGLKLAKLISKQNKVIVYDYFDSQIHGETPSFNNLIDPNISIVRANISEQDTLAKCIKESDSIIHLASFTGTAQSMYESFRYTNNNCSLTSLIFDIIQKENFKLNKFIIASSRSIYGEGKYLCNTHGIIYPEPRSYANLKNRKYSHFCNICGDELTSLPSAVGDFTKPASIYALTKLYQEEMVRIHCNSLGIKYGIFRLQNVYGEGQSLQNPYTGILSIFSNQIRLNKDLNIYEDGNTSRDFIHVDDVVNIFYSYLTKCNESISVDVGTGVSTKIIDVARLLKNIYRSNVNITINNNFRIGDIRTNYADISLLKEKLGISNFINLENGLLSLSEWVLAQPLFDDKTDLAMMILNNKKLGG